LNRDPVDAAADADILNSILQIRADEILNEHSNTKRARPSS
jgi:hypothetical protein